MHGYIHLNKTERINFCSSFTLLMSSLFLQMVGHLLFLDITNYCLVIHMPASVACYTLLCSLLHISLWFVTYCSVACYIQLYGLLHTALWLATHCSVAYYTEFCGLLHLEQQHPNTVQLQCLSILPYEQLLLIDKFKSKTHSLR